jgi:hypothetical protein
VPHEETNLPLFNNYPSFDLPAGRQGVGPRTLDIKHGDIVSVEVGEKPDFWEQNWYKIITGTAVMVGIYATLNR